MEEQAQRSKFRDGSIVRIRCHQFLTYREVTIRPGSRLNVVVGPNGSGKSSIVCAIAIGLGLPPRLLGRSDKLGEFVMQGYDDGFVEVELYRSDRANTVVKRSLKRESDSGSTWLMDGKSSSPKKVQELLERLGVQISNLCTFLPQEKVGEFSGFDSTQLLVETEKAIRPDLHETHLALASMERDLNDQERQLDAKKARVAELAEQNAALERDREKMAQRTAHLDKVELCRQRLLWVDFVDVQSQCSALSAEKKAIEAKLKAASGGVEPLAEALRNASVDLQRASKRVDEGRKALEGAARRHAAALERANRELGAAEELKEGVANVGARAAETEKKVAVLRRKVAEKKDRLASHDAEGVRQQVNELRASLASSSAEYNQAWDKKEGAVAAEKAAGREVETARRALSEVEERSGVQARALAHSGGADSLKLRDWLATEGRGQFRSPVTGPIALEMNILRPEYRDVVEGQCSATVLRGFVTQCDEDHRQLKNVIKNHKWQITVYNIEGGKQKARKPLPHASLLADGVVSVLEDLMECSPVVCQVLRDHAMMDSAMVGDGRLAAVLERDPQALTNRLFEQGPNPSQSTLYIQGGGGGGGGGGRGGGGSGFRKFTGRKSRYQSGQVSTSVTVVRPGRALVQGEDPTVRERLQRDLAAAQDRLAAAAGAVAALSGGVETLRRQRAQVEAALSAKRAELSVEKKLGTEIKGLENKLAHADEEMRRLDVAKERKVMGKKLGLCLMKRADALAQASLEAGSRLELEASRGAAAAGLELCKDLHAGRRRRLEAEKRQLDQYTHSLADAKNRFKDAKRSLRQAQNDANEGAPIWETRDDGVKVALPLNDLLKTLPETRGEVEAMMSVEQEAADKIHDNPAVLRQYKERVAEMAALNEAIALAQGEGGGPRGRFQQLKDEWVGEVTSTAAQLNALFGEYMGALGNTGRVEVRQSLCGFSDWGLNLLVSFRSGYDPVPLRKTVQSGGERSVSTIMFLMALQDMVASPFRVVDEINQGMDERNERLVFKRIVDRSVGPTRPQYFLITPKLLQGLTSMDHEDVTVLFVFNGPWNLEKPQKWDLGAFFDAKQRQLDQKGQSDDDPTKRRRLTEH